MGTLFTALGAAAALSNSNIFPVHQGGARALGATGTQLLALVGTAYVPLAGGTMTGALTLPAGAVGTPQLMFTGAGTTNGFYSSGANNISIAINGVRNCYFEPNATYIAGSSGLVIQNTSALLYFGLDGLLSLQRDAAGSLAQRNGTNAQTLRVYGTADGSPGSNYQRASLSANGTTGITLAAEGLGTPTANQDITLLPGGTGVVRFGTRTAIGAETVTGYITIKDSGGTVRKLAVVS